MNPFKPNSSASEEKIDPLIKGINDGHIQPREKDLHG